jgi:quinoprotein glucose dehydrogenase
VANPAEGLAVLTALPPEATLLERQRAITALGSLQDPGATLALAGMLDRQLAGELDPALSLDVLEAARARGASELEERLAAIDAEAPATDLVAARAWAQAGGDAGRGRLVFQGAGDCQRCHGAAGHGGGTGPELAGIGRRADARTLLEAVVDPQAEIATGFASVSVTRNDGGVVSGTLLEETGDLLLIDADGERTEIPKSEITTRTAAASGMPPMGLTLEPRDLRDLIAYLETL